MLFDFAISLCVLLPLNCYGGFKVPCPCDARQRAQVRCASQVRVLTSHDMHLRDFCARLLRATCACASRHALGARATRTGPTCTGPTCRVSAAAVLWHAARQATWLAQGTTCRVWCVTGRMPGRATVHSAAYVSPWVHSHLDTSCRSSVTAQVVSKLCIQL